MSLYASGIVRIITEPALRSFDSGTMVANFAGGIMEGKDKQGNYINNAIDIEIWGKSAEIVVDRCKKVIASWSAVTSNAKTGRIRPLAISAASMC
jgi:hypothetical protein